MTWRSLLALGAPLALAAPLAAQNVFQGTIVNKITANGQSIESTIMTNGVRTRSETGMGGQSFISITDLGEGKSYTLMPAQKKYIVIDLKAAMEMASQMGESMRDKKGKPETATAPDLSKVPKITATGQKETIAGYSCEGYTMQMENGSVLNFCIAKGLGTYSLMGMAPGGMGGMGGLGGGSPYARALASNPALKQLMEEFKDGFFPLKVTMTEGGTVKMTSEVTKIEKGSVPASAFAIPSDYTELKMPGGFGLPKRP